MIRAEICTQLVSIDSTAAHGTRDIVSFVKEVAESEGLEAQVVQDNIHGVENANVIIRLPHDKAKKNLLMISSLDTPDPGEYGAWVKTGANPFKVSQDGKEIYGLGVQDAKADFACKLAAM